MMNAIRINKMEKEIPGGLVNLQTGKADGSFTTEDLMKAGFTRDEANELMEQLSDAGMVRLIPLVSGLN